VNKKEFRKWLTHDIIFRVANDENSEPSSVFMQHKIVASSSSNPTHPPSIVVHAIHHMLSSYQLQKDVPALPKLLVVSDDVVQEKRSEAQSCSFCVIWLSSALPEFRSQCYPQMQKEKYLWRWQTAEIVAVIEAKEWVEEAV
jgi:hypothetical protein